MSADPGMTHALQTPVTSGDRPPSGVAEILNAELTALSKDSTVTPPNALLAAEGASVYVYSFDPAFQSAVEAAAEDRYAITPVEDWSELVTAVERGDCKIALLDADSMRGRVDWRIAKLQVSAAWSVIMIAASRERAPYLMELLWQHRIHRLVIKPPGHGVTRILMKSAVVRYRQLRDDPSQRSQLPSEKVKQGSRLAPLLHLRNPQLVATYLVLAVAVVTMMGVLLAPLPGSPTAVPIPVDATETLTAEAIAQAEAVAEQLQFARQAVGEGRVTTPEGASALDYYATILIHDPTHAEATTRIGRLVDDLFSQAESALLADSTDRAALALGHIRRVQPENTRLAFLDHQLQRALADEQDQLVFPEVDLSTPLPVVAAIPSLSELDSLLTVADVRLRNGQLILPSGDSAFDYLKRAAILSPDDPLVLVTGADLGEAISASVRIALDSGDLADAERRIGAARELNAPAEPLTAFDAEIAIIQTMAAEELASAQHAALFAQGQDRLQRGQLVTPEQDSAFYYLDALRAQQPDYPNLTDSWQQLTTRVASNAAQAIGAGDWAAGESWLTALERIDVDSELRSELGDELSASRLQERYLAVTGPPSELVLLSAEPLGYPRSALQAAIEGWVDLEFVVGRDGYVGEISVIGAEPEGRFEPEAIASVSTYRYEPFELDGRVYERRLSLRVRFALE